ncbi:hypothetical protein TNCV_1508221 [Trichonephila clavipes]|nr:hypothetical protein TNCV_1508221 [Trichonephila clavipes]
MKELSNGQLQDDFLQSLWLQKNATTYPDCLSASSEPLDKLAIIADKVSEVVGASSTICAATTVPPPSQSSSCSAQPIMDSLARQIQELSLQVAELTESTIPLATNDIVLTAGGDHIHALGCQWGKWHLLLSSPL